MRDQLGPDAHAFSLCAGASTVTGACEGLVEDLHERYPLPSVYLLIDGRLRCQAALGYFQVVDGFTPGTGIIGRVVATGTPVVLDDVSKNPEFIAAIPGLAAEVCVPVRLEGTVIGAVNVECTTALPDDTCSVLAMAAAALASCIHALGGLPPVALSQRLARIAVSLSTLTDAADIERRVVAEAIDISGMNSAVLCRRAADGQWSIGHVSGPLTAALAGWTATEYRLLAGWVKAETSSHFRGEPADLPPEYAFLHGAGIRAVMVHPLVSGAEITGLLTTAHPEQVEHDPVVSCVLDGRHGDPRVALCAIESLCCAQVSLVACGHGLFVCCPLLPQTTVSRRFVIERNTPAEQCPKPLSHHRHCRTFSGRSAGIGPVTFREDVAPAAPAVPWRERADGHSGG